MRTRTTLRERGELLLAFGGWGDSAAFKEAVRLAWHAQAFERLHYSPEIFRRCAEEVRRKHKCRCEHCRERAAAVREGA